MRTHTSGLRRKVRLITLGAVCAPGCVFAQESTRIPAQPPVVLFGRRVNVVVAAPRALAQGSDSLRLAHALETCPPAIRGAFPIAYANEPTGARGAFRDDRVVFIVVPTSISSGGCYAIAPSDPALLTRGVQVVATSALDARNDIRAVEVSVGGQVVPADSSFHRPVVTLAGSAQSNGPPSQVAVWIPARYLAPDATGHFPEVALRVSTADSSPPDVVRLAGEPLRGIWRDLIVARIERLGDARAVRAPMQLPLPKDNALRQAHALYSSGQVVAAAKIAEQRLAANQLSREDTRAARMLIAGTLLAYDDSSVARILLADVLADAPCLTLSGGQAATARMLDALRPPARCSVMPLGRVLLASLVPGMGYEVTGNRGVAVVAAGLTSVGAAMAWNLGRTGDQAYHRYLDARSTTEALSAYDDATRSRRKARVALGYMAAAWFLAGSTAVVAEQFHARHVAHVHDYDVRPTVGWLPDARGGEARISMRVTW